MRFSDFGQQQQGLTPLQAVGVSLEAIGSMLFNPGASYYGPGGGQAPPGYVYDPTTGQLVPGTGGSVSVAGSGQLFNSPVVKVGIGAALGFYLGGKSGKGAAIGAGLALFFWK